MKSLYLTLFSILSTCSLFGQLCDFDSPDWTYTITSTGTYSISNASPDYPANSNFGLDGSRALISSGGQTIIELAVQNTLSSPSAYLEFKIGANALSGSGKGMDAGTDYISLEYRMSSSSTWVEFLRVKGYSNILYGISDEGLCMRSELTSPLVYTPSTGGTISSELSPSAWLVDGLPQTDSLMIRFVIFSDRTNEVWSVDHIELHKPVFWTNAAGDGSIANSLNWSHSQVPDSSVALFWSDTLPILPPLTNSRFCRLLTSASSSCLFANSQIEVGEWVHSGDSIEVDSTLCIDSRLGSGEVVLLSGAYSGKVSLVKRFNFNSGYRHLSVPLSTTWGDVTEDCSNVVYNSGVNTSIYAWDPNSENWFSPSNGAYPTHQSPVALYGGGSWLDSSNVIRVSGKVLMNDTSTIIYGTPNSNSPFSTMMGNDGWNFIGNPFPFSVSLDDLLTDADFPVEVSPTVYVWNGESGTYSSYNSTTGSSQGGLPVLRPWQAAWVQMNTNPGTYRTIQWKSSYATSTVLSPIQKTGNPIRTEFDVLLGDESRKLVVVDMNGASNNWSSSWDQYQRNERAFEVCFRIQHQSDSLPVSLKALNPNDIGGLAVDVFGTPGETAFITAPDSSTWWLENRATSEWHAFKVGEYAITIPLVGKKRVYLWRENPNYTSVYEVNAIRKCAVPIYSNGTWNNSSDCSWRIIDLHGRELGLIDPHKSMCKVVQNGIYVLQSESEFSRIVVQSH